MLKSHLALHKNDTEEEEEEENVKKVEEEEESVAVEHEPIIIVDSEKRYLKKSEVSVRLSFLGKTADGDG